MTSLNCPTCHGHGSLWLSRDHLPGAGFSADPSPACTAGSSTSLNSSAVIHDSSLTALPLTSAPIHHYSTQRRGAAAVRRRNKLKKTFRSQADLRQPSGDIDSSGPQSEESDSPLYRSLTHLVQVNYKNQSVWTCQNCSSKNHSTYQRCVVCSSCKQLPSTRLAGVEYDQRFSTQSGPRARSSKYRGYRSTRLAYSNSRSVSDLKFAQTECDLQDNLIVNTSLTASKYSAHHSQPHQADQAFPPRAASFVLGSSVNEVKVSNGSLNRRRPINNHVTRRRRRRDQGWQAGFRSAPGSPLPIHCQFDGESDEDIGSTVVATQTGTS